uniref:Uncharacterized protein n=1 Tax=Rhizophora mucronata TaxID=61149 RepID=A0A2P2MP61_RHIMU
MDVLAKSVVFALGSLFVFLSLFTTAQFELFLQVRLIGYCVEDSLFLVYEYIENGNLSQHLRGSGKIAFAF